MFNDPQTGLPDRRALFAHLDGCLNANQSLQNLTAIMVIKINRLKRLNLEFGYGQTDQLISDIAAKCAGCLREDDFIARVSGSEFAVVFRGLQSAAQPTLAANKIRNEFKDPLPVNDENIKVNLSFGIAISPLDGIGAEDAYRCADIALEEGVTRSISIARYGDFEPADDDHSVTLERDLETAITEGQLSNVFQPIIELNSGKLRSVELLLRWQSVKHGQVSPEDFVPLAERCNLITRLTTWTVNNGFREFAQCRALADDVTIAINISAVLLTEPNIVTLIVNAAALWEISTSRITIEVTETAMMVDPDKCFEVITKLHAQGMQIAIDDFGTGYSSLEYLKKLPARILKIDKTFVTHMLTTIENRQIVQAVIDLAKNMGMTVVAEGVEDEITLDQLALMGCGRAQGYYISKPIPIDELEQWYDQYLPSAAGQRKLRSVQ